MKTIFTIISITLISAFATGAAADEPIIQPGLYGVLINSDGNDMKSDACLEANQIATLQDLIINTLEEMDNCAVNFVKRSQSNAEWEMACTEYLATRTTAGTITWTPTSFSGAAKSKMGKIEVEYAFKGERIGNCE